MPILNPQDRKSPTSADLATSLTAPTEPRLLGPIASFLVTGVIFAAALILAFFIAMVVGALLHPSGTDAFFTELDDAAFATSPAMQRFEWLAQLFGFVLVALFTILVAVLRGRKRFGEQLALNLNFPKRISWIAFGAIAATMFIETALEELFPPLRELVEAYIKLPFDPAALWIAAAATVIGAPIAEELVFRGFLYTSFRAKWGYVPALVVTSLLFSALHFEETGIGMYALLILPGAFLLGWMRERSGGIALPIAMHAFMNFGAFLTALYRGV